MGDMGGAPPPPNENIYPCLPHMYRFHSHSFTIVITCSCFLSIGFLCSVCLHCSVCGEDQCCVAPTSSCATFHCRRKGGSKENKMYGTRLLLHYTLAVFFSRFWELQLCYFRFEAFVSWWCIHSRKGHGFEGVQCKACSYGLHYNVWKWLSYTLLACAFPTSSLAQSILYQIPVIKNLLRNYV